MSYRRQVALEWEEWSYRATRPLGRPSQPPSRSAVRSTTSLRLGAVDSEVRDPVLPDNRRGIRYLWRRSSSKAEESTLTVYRSDNANTRRRKSHGSHQA